MKPGESLLTIPEVASRLKKSVRYMWGAIARHEISFQRIGRSVRLSEADVAAFVARGRQEAR